MSIEDARRNEYDETIKKEVAFYDQKFSGTPGFVALDMFHLKITLLVVAVVCLYAFVCIG